MNEGIQSQLEQTGLQFNSPDLAPFRARLQEAGFYKKWADSFGPECWGLLEKYTGTLV